MTGARFWPGRLGVSAALMCALTLMAASARAGQASEGTIFGQVTDESGAVLPGVTVTVSGPALIVKQMVEASDVRGEYRVTPLPLGVYTVEYTLSGFQTQRREGIRLTAGFVAKIDIQLQVGSVEETITVSGESPVVDVTTTTQGTQVTRDLLESIPTSRNGFAALMTLSAGTRPGPDDGKTSADDPRFRAFGRPNEAWIVVEGISTTGQFSGQVGYSNSFSYESVDETQVQTIGGSAESPTAGVQLNVIMKSGGNVFHGSGLLGEYGKWMQSDNLDAELQSLGIQSIAHVNTRWDRGGDLGGPINRDKLWFYGAARKRRNQSENLGAFLADGSPSLEQTDKTFLVGKVTGQLSTTQKVIGSYQWEKRDGSNGPRSSFDLPEISTHNQLSGHVGKAEWQLARGNKFLSVVGGGWVSTGPPQDTRQDVGPSWRDTTTGYFGGANALNRGGQSTDLRRYEGRTTFNWYKPEMFFGNHDFKIGGNYYKSSADFPTADRGAAGNYQLRYRSPNGTVGPGGPFTGASAANQVDIGNNPVNPITRLDYVGIFIQDSWTINRRLTLNLGLRYTNDRGWLPRQCRDAAPAPFQDLFPAQCFEEFHANTWNPVSPRLHFAWDLQGNGKMVVKGGWGRFTNIHTQDELNLANENANSTARFRWRDLNGNAQWDTGESNLDVNGADFLQLTRAVNQNLSGLINNPDLKAPGSNEYYGSVEREVAANFGVRATAVYSKNYNTIRVLNPFRPYSAYNIPVPNVDPGEDGRVGTADDPGRVITYYDYPAELAGNRFQQLMFVNHSPSDTSYTSFEFAATRRLVDRWQLSTSLTTTKINNPVIYEVSGPSGNAAQRGFFSATLTPNAEINSAWRSREWQARIGGSYLAPWDVQIASNVSITSGEPWARTMNVTGAERVGDLEVYVEPIGTRTHDAVTLVALSIQKSFRIGSGHRLSVGTNILNLLNANTIFAEDVFPYEPGYVKLSGASFGQARQLIYPRIGEITIKYSF